MPVAGVSNGSRLRFQLSSEELSLMACEIAAGSWSPTTSWKAIEVIMIDPRVIPMELPEEIPGKAASALIFKDEQGADGRQRCMVISARQQTIQRNTRPSSHASRMHTTTKCSRLIVHSDSELMVRQLLGEYKVKDQNLKALFLKVQRMLAKAPFEFEINTWSERSNREADQLANLGIDSKKRIRI